MIKVLFVTYDFPYPPTSGGKSRAFNLMKYGIDKNISLSLLSFVREDFKKEWTQELKKIGVEDVIIYKRKKLKSAKTLLKNLLSKNSIFRTLYFDEKFFKILKETIEKNKIDIVHFESSYTGYYIGKELKKLGVKQILGTENIEYLLYKDYLENSKNFIKKSALSYQVKRFRREEEEMMKEADLCLAVTKEEAEYIKSASGTKCEVIENAISIKDLKFGFSKENKNNLLFVGNFIYMPNVKAVKYFIKEVLPKFDKNITLTVIGKKINSVIERSERIITKEFVDDLISEYKKADALVFPIKIGGGTNFKILEAMALGTPVLGFSEKIKNTGARVGEEFFEANSPEEFLRQYNKIRNDKKEVERIVKNARKLIEQNYSWEKVGRKLNSIWSKIIE